MELNDIDMFERRLAALVDEYGMSAYTGFAFYHDSTGALKCAASKHDNPKGFSVQASNLCRSATDAAIVALQETGTVNSMEVNHDRITIVGPRKESIDKKAPLTDDELLKTDFGITLDVLSALSVIGTIQLASRHPNYTGPSRAVAIAFALELQEKVAEIAPSMEVILSMGWNPAFDVE
jgi:hypothetical protein